MAKKKEAASRLLKALGKTKKEQMDKLYPKVKSKGPYARKTKAPYLRGKVMGAGDLITRRAAVAGTKFPSPTKKKGIGITDVVAAGAAGLAVGSGQHKKAWGSIKKHLTKKKEDTHLDKARRGAKELIKKQKEKKKRRTHHD